MAGTRHCIRCEAAGKLVAATRTLEVRVTLGDRADTGGRPRGTFGRRSWPVCEECGRLLDTLIPTHVPQAVREWLDPIYERRKHGEEGIRKRADQELQRSAD